VIPAVPALPGLARLALAALLLAGAGLVLAELTRSLRRRPHRRFSRNCRRER